MSEQTQTTQETLSQQSRIEYIDCMRGFLIFCVVLGHVILFNLGADRSPLFSIIYSFHMPLFFFITGVLSYSEKGKTSWSKKLKDRFFNILLPTIVTGGVCCLFLNASFLTALCDPMKHGYWFTITLFQIFCIYAFITWSMEKLEFPKLCKLIVYLSIIVGAHIIKSYTFRYANFLCDEKWFGALGIRQLLLYLGVFFFGVTAKMYYANFIKIIENGKVASLLLLLYVVLFTMFSNYGVCLYLRPFVAILLVYMLFCHYRDFFSKATRIGGGIFTRKKVVADIPFTLLHFTGSSRFKKVYFFVGFMRQQLADIIACIWHYLGIDCILQSYFRKIHKSIPINVYPNAWE